MTKLMDQAIEYLRQLPAEEQDTVAQQILQSAHPVEDAERQRILGLLAEADDDFANGRYTEDLEGLRNTLKDRIRSRYF